MNAVDTRARKLFYYSLPCLLLLASACNSQDDWKAQTYPAKGSISINGESPTGAVIILKFTDNPPDRRKSQPYGIVEQDGTYQMSTYGMNDGAPAGNYAVTLFWQNNPGSKTADDRLNGAYNSIESSPMKITIHKTENVIPHIELKGVKVNRKPAPDDRKSDKTATIPLPIKQK